MYKDRDFHAEPGEVMQPQQGLHRVGNAGVTTFCRKGVYSTLHRYNPNFEHLEIHVADVAMVDVLGMCIYASPLEF